MLNASRPGEALRVVLDTNVLLSLWVFTDSALLPFRDEIASGRWQALANTPCLEEFKRVLGYPEFELDSIRQQAIYADYVRAAHLVAGIPVERIPLPSCRDRDDQKFLELARDGQAQYLITRDKALLALAKRKPAADYFRILTPEAMMERREVFAGME